MKNLYNNIPQYVREHGLFCCWKLNAQKGKVPYNPLNGECASSSDPKTFTDFEMACSIAKKEKYDGIGLGIFGDICAIDIDHCVTETGELTKLASDIVAMMQSYAELSPSGKGVRILFQAKDFDYDKDRYYIINPKRKLEVYVAGVTNKYVTVTGNRIDPFPDLASFGVRSENLQTILDLYMKRDESADVAVNGKFAVNGNLGANDGMPERAIHARNGAKFERLYMGDFSTYCSQSEADFALCSQLAFWTQKNPQRMDQLFRSSGLMRPKWDEKRGGFAKLYFSES